MIRTKSKREKMIAFSGSVFTAYSQLTLGTGPLESVDFEAAFAGQANGLLGAGVQGGLFLLTVTHTGDIDLTVRIEDRPPPIGQWQDVVEAPFEPLGKEITMVSWDGEFVMSAPITQRPYRVRWSADGADLSRSSTPTDDTEKYELCFWPASREKDEVVREGSSYAKELNLAKKTS